MMAVPPRIIGHRGSSGVAPENTQAAFRRAADEGADMVELDVRLTRDGVPVVHHDRRLGRTTTGRGRLCDRDLRELAGVDAGSWFSHRYRREPLPTLASVFEHLSTRVGVNVEVKTDGDTPRRALYVERLIPLLRSALQRRTLLISSFDHTLLARIHSLDPSLPIGVLYLSVRDFGVRPSRLVRRTGAVAFICSRAQLRRRHVLDARAAHLRVIVYGVNTVRHLRRVLRLGADDVITDVPGRLRWSSEWIRHRELGNEQG